MAERDVPSTRNRWGVVTIAGHILRSAHRLAIRNAAPPREWYRIVNAEHGEPAVVFIYDEIGFFGVDASLFVRDLRAINASEITVHINSPGGDVFDGIAIHNALRDHPAEVTTVVDALAASIASVIAMAGDRIVMAQHSTMMIHEAFGFALGDAADMRRQADFLDRSSDTLANIYAGRAGGAASEWRALMDAETWFSDTEAVEAGLADAVAGDAADAPAAAIFDLSIFRHAPGAKHSEPELESDDPPPVLPDWRREATAKLAAAMGV